MIWAKKCFRIFFGGGCLFDYNYTRQGIYFKYIVFIFVKKKMFVAACD